MEIDNSIAQKIRKLLKLQESAEKVGSIQEAANAAARIQEMLAKYNLELSQIPGEEQRKNAETEEAHIPFSEVVRKSEGVWLLSLYHLVFIANNCFMFTRNKRTVVAVGTKMNLETSVYMVNQLEARLIIMEKESWRTYTGPTLRNAFRRAYLAGAASEVGKKLQEQTNELKKNSAMTGLMVIQSKAVMEHVERIAPNLKSGTSRGYSGGDAAARGRADGRAMSLHKGVN